MGKGQVHQFIDHFIEMHAVFHEARMQNFAIALRHGMLNALTNQRKADGRKHAKRCVQDTQLSHIGKVVSMRVAQQHHIVLGGAGRLTHQQVIEAQKASNAPI